MYTADAGWKTTNPLQDLLSVVCNLAGAAAAAPVVPLLVLQLLLLPMLLRSDARWH